MRPYYISLAPAVVLGLVVATSPGSAAAQQSADARASSAGTVSPAPNSAAALIRAPFRAGDRLFNADQSGALYVRDGQAGQPRLLLPAESFSVVAPSHDGRYLAYGQGAPGAADYDVRVRDVATGRDLPDLLHNASISRAPWTHNDDGFFYSRDDTAGKRQRVYYHSLHRAEARDGIILSEFSHPEFRYNTVVSDDGLYAVFTITHPIDSHTRLYFIDLNDAGHPKLDNPVVKLVESFDARYEFVDNAAAYFFLQTDRGAPFGRLLLANTDITREARWPILIPQSSDSLLYVRTAGNQYVIAVYESPTGNVGRIYGPPDPAVVRAELLKRLDSLRKARANGDQPRRVINDRNDMIMREPAPLRLELRSDLSIPARASIVAMNSVADQDQLFYTLKLPDGTLRSYAYNVTNGATSPFSTFAAR